MVFGSSGFSTSFAGELTYPIVDTGQDICYDNVSSIEAPEKGKDFYGQDAQFAGNSFSFKNLGNGVVQDLTTGLMWQQIPVANDFTWQEAVDYCESLELGGYDDWRMPSAKELFSISDFSQGGPYIDTNYFALAGGRISKDQQYWTSNYYIGTTVEGGSDAAFGVNVVTGHIKAYPAKARGPIGGKYVRAVRGDAYGVNDFVDNGDGTISDKASGLMWTKVDSGPFDWQTALNFAQNSTCAGYSDWRLPNIKELQSIVDYSYSPSATESDKIGPAINPLFSLTPTTENGGNSDYGFYWSGTSALFMPGQPYYYAWYVAFGRAVNHEGRDLHGAGAVRFDTKEEDGPAGEGGERVYNYVLLVRTEK